MSDDLHQQLRELRTGSEARSSTDWDRSLPFADALFDRWERAATLDFGARSSIYDSAIVFGDVEVGEDTWIGPNVLIDGSGAPVRIGNGCDISAAAHIYSHDTVLRCVSLRSVGTQAAPVTIGDAVYLGPQSVIVAGISIGSRSVVGANSFVNSDVPERTVVAGSPARVVGHVVGSGPATKIVPVSH